MEFGDKIVRACYLFEVYFKPLLVRETTCVASSRGGVPGEDVGKDV